MIKSDHLSPSTSRSKLIGHTERQSPACIASCKNPLFRLGPTLAPRPLSYTRPKSGQAGMKSFRRRARITLRQYWTKELTTICQT